MLRKKYLKNYDDFTCWYIGDDMKKVVFLAVAMFFLAIELKASSDPNGPVFPKYFSDFKSEIKYWLSYDPNTFYLKHSWPHFKNSEEAQGRPFTYVSAEFKGSGNGTFIDRILIDSDDHKGNKDPNFVVNITICRHPKMDLKFWFLPFSRNYVPPVKAVDNLILNDIEELLSIFDSNAIEDPNFKSFIKEFLN